ncbi:GNAT family N-acetyltransferase [Pelagicoccus sp. NFK12]|uniref:GNAT family N-acetyltransferase n=1 Tax=Pelagicoccus enzymogenes TaxID=2773457 RepID=A0A927F4Y8_9BACT|nr:GNAT family N-acyltransferase [Pelagicoccus enzymogenes]MBD5778150.1 GNAT family N-acetyltransferase [Pelagicoccus enzymogenes]MDQ8198093.1 GNAT family N-acyltransferase [Pelagicoccus enzymogenes]
MPISANDRRKRVERFIPPSPTSAYKVRISGSDLDIAQAQRLRYRVFNLELGEGLAASEATGKDADPFDLVCDHLLVEHVVSGEIIGTYRLQTGESALANIGYYSEQEFDFAPYESIRSETIELGRACIAKEHRNMVVLGLLWKGIAQYAKLCGARYLIGCSSITSTNPLEGQAAFRKLSRYLVAPEFLTKATEKYDCSATGEDESEIIALSRTVDIPRLMRAYLTLGARICGEPALDREFKTIDFLTLLDLRSLGPRAMSKFLG